MKTKRIVIDASPLFNLYTGIGRSTMSFLKALLKVGCPYDIMLFGRRLLAPPLKTIIKDKFKTRHLRLPRSWEPFIRSTRLIEILCRGDLYHATDFYMPLKHPELAIATIHDLIFLIDPEKMVDHIRLSKWVPAFIRRCRHIITVSEFSKKDIVNELGVDPKLIEVIYWGVDRNIFYPPDDREKLKKRLGALLGMERPYFLAVACSTGRKNTPFLLQAYAQLVHNNPQNDLVLVWDPPQDIYQQYCSSELIKRVHFIGRQSDQSLRDLYSGATAVVFPSLYEGFGFPILEGMSCGAPVITSNITSMPEIGGDAALYVNPLDVKSIISALEAFENEPSMVKELRGKGLKHAARFTWERCVKETLAVYDCCLNR
jgi:glycosyltransferase involved in cell wall biosynthesis